MSRRLIVRPEAEADIIVAAQWYEARLAGLGVDLVRQVELAINRAVDAPRQFPLLRRQPEVRRVLTRRFPYRIFFVLSDETVVVFAVIHAAQHDRHWRGRL